MTLTFNLNFPVVGMYIIHQSNLVGQRVGLVGRDRTNFFIRKRDVNLGDTVALVIGLIRTSVHKADIDISEIVAGPIWI